MNSYFSFSFLIRCKHFFLLAKDVTIEEEVGQDECGKGDKTVVAEKGEDESWG